MPAGNNKPNGIIPQKNDILSYINDKVDFIGRYWIRVLSILVLLMIIWLVWFEVGAASQQVSFIPESTDQKTGWWLDWFY